MAHGMSHTPEHKAWLQMKTRCLNPNHQAFSYYGGRGITVCPEWIESFEAFFAHVGRRPSRRHSLDRIDNERGYEPGNVRWATAREQANNRRPARKVEGCSSRFIGVSWDRSRQQWQAYVKANGHRYSLGRFDSEEEAAMARDLFVERMGLTRRMNFPVNDTESEVA